MAIVDGKKRCPRCDGWLPATLEHFYRHAGKRVTDGFQSYCKPCTKSKAVEWQKANPEKKAAADRKQDQKPERIARHRERTRAYFEKNRDQELARLAAWQAANPVRTREYRKAWAEANPDRVRAYHEKHYAKPERKQYLRDLSRYRRTVEKGSGGEVITGETWLIIVDLFGSKCCYCDKTGKLTIEHIDPISRGGKHAVSNLAPACDYCNKAKKTKTVEQFCPERAAAIRERARLNCEELGHGQSTNEASAA
jgi:5-methylcytosine-specific restriction endonuclease McrA